MFISLFPPIFTNYNYGGIKQNFIFDVFYSMETILNQINEIDKTYKVEENLYVKNIIVNKDKTNKKITTYVATEKWLNQLGERLLS